MLNPNQIFNVDARFVNEDNAADWLAEDPNHALLIADDPSQGGFQTCDVDTSSISVFDMQVLSRLTGAGDYEGTLFLDHMPVSYSKRFSWASVPTTTTAIKALEVGSVGMVN